MATWCNDFNPGGPIAIPNQWNHVATVLNGTAVSLYMNGVQVNGTLGGYNIVNPQNLAIGCTDYPGRYFDGYIDEVRVWDFPKTQAQILASMNSPLNGNEPGLRGYWGFDFQNAVDFSGNGIDGTINGNVSMQPGGPFGTSWISYVTILDTLQPGDSAYVPIEFNSCDTALGPGNFYSEIYIVSNDPNNPVVYLEINGEVTMTLSGTCLDFDTVFVNGTYTDTLMIFSVDCDTLFVDSILNNLAEYSVDTTNFAVAPQDTQVW